MEKLLTIVIPSYNVERTLRHTVESLLVSDLTLRMQLDILIVNDGSKDDTLNLAKKFELENPGIVRVWDKANGGHGSTINVGIEQGYGKYMKVVDGDDWIDTVAFEEYLRILANTDADVIATDYYHYYMDSGKQEVVKSSRLSYGKTMKFADIWENYTFFFHSLAVKTEIMRNQSHRIDEHCYYVDVEYDTLVAMVAETVLYVDTKLYIYRLSYAGQSVSVEGWMRHYLEHERVVFTLLDWYKYFNLANSGREKLLYIEKRILNLSIGHYKIGLTFSKEERRRFVVHLKEFDDKLQRISINIYLRAKKDIVIRVCRFSHFSYLIYTGMGIIKKRKSIFLQRWKT